MLKTKLILNICFFRAFAEIVEQYAIHNVNQTRTITKSRIRTLCFFQSRKEVAPLVDNMLIAFQYSKGKTTTDISMGRPETRRNARNIVARRLHIKPKYIRIYHVNNFDQQT